MPDRRLSRTTRINRTTRTVFAVAAALFAAVADRSAAETPRSTLLVDVPWLVSHRADPKLVLLHVGEEKEYKAGHIPGARYVSYGDDPRALAVSDHSGKGLMLEMLPADTLRARLEALGISDDSQVVVYFGKNWVSPTTRILFTLDYAGLDRVSMLDGGMPAWTAAGQQLASEIPPVAAGKLSPLKTRPTVVDAAFVREHAQAPGYALIDGRSAVFYDGVDVGGGHAGPHKVGHVAGAASVPYDSLTTEDLKWKSPAELEAAFTKAGAEAGETVIGYCHIGQQATAMLFAARTLGRKVLLYDGSFEDWSARDGAVEAPAAAPEKK
jgi:thiosulfate/3-mercaptopyruvate sulfurtransferase